MPLLSGCLAERQWLLLCCALELHQDVASHTHHHSSLSLTDRSLAADQVSKQSRSSHGWKCNIACVRTQHQCPWQKRGIADKVVFKLFFSTEIQRGCRFCYKEDWKPYPINGNPRYIIVWRVQGLGLQGILMHQLITQIPLHTFHDVIPAQVRFVEFCAL